MLKFQSNAVRWKWKYMTAPLITIYSQFLKETLCCITPLFHEFTVWDWNDVPILLGNVWLFHLIFQIQISVGYLSLVSGQSWKWYINRKVMRLLLVHRIIKYMTVNYWLWKYCIKITYMLHKVLHWCLTI